MSLEIVENNIIALIRDQLRRSETYKMTIQTGTEIGEEVQKTSSQLTIAYIEEKIKENLPLLIGVGLILFLVIKK